MKDLTEIQRQTYNDIIKFYKENGYPPTVRELTKIYNITLGAVQDRLRALQSKGYIHISGVSRGIKLLKFKVNIDLEEIK